TGAARALRRRARAGALRREPRDTRGRDAGLRAAAAPFALPAAAGRAVLRSRAVPLACRARGRDAGDRRGTDGAARAKRDGALRAVHRLSARFAAQPVGGAEPVAALEHVLPVARRRAPG